MPDVQPSNPMQSTSWAVNWLMASQGYNVDQTAVAVMSTKVLSDEHDNLETKRTQARENYNAECDRIRAADYFHVIVWGDPAAEAQARAKAKQDDLDEAKKAYNAEIKRYDDRSTNLFKVSAQITQR